MNLLPPADLLEKVSGVEQGLRDNQKGGRLAGAGLVLSVAQLLLASDLFGDGNRSSVQEWWLSVGAIILAASLTLFARSRVWIRESSSPFRYTCSIARFHIDGPPSGHDCSELRTWLKYDLAEKLNQRIPRLSFLEDSDPEKEPPGEGTNEHIHISGDILVRRRKDDKLWIEVTPRVRVGKKGQPAALAQSVSRVWETTAKTDDSIQMSREESSGNSLIQTVRPKDYEKILERVYFNLASHIYRQIEADIQRKIRLLPGKYLRATAYLHEADDYGNSNTLDGLDHATHFYRSAMALYDPCLRRRPHGRIRRAGAALLRAEAILVRQIRRVVARLVLRVARKEVRIARAEVGLANALLHRRTLAGLSGRRLNSIYEAPVMTRSAIRRMKHLPEDVPGRQPALFDAYVSRALAYFQLESPRAANEHLNEARSVMPGCYDQEPSYLYVQALLEELPASAIRFLRLAVERQPRFEVAHFELAVRSEMVWRNRPTLEEKVARVILEEYDQVLNLNPGNVAASGHAAYIHWLLRQPEAATSYYEQGSEFKGIKPETAIGELDYGMARIAVEEGAARVEKAKAHAAGTGEDGKVAGNGWPGQRLEHDPLFRAYRHYVRAATAQLFQGVSDWKSTSAQFYFFDAISDEMMARYRSYYEAAEIFLKSGPSNEERVRQTVMSFVANDYGEACYTYYLRNCDRRWRLKAERLFQAAKDKNSDAMLPRYNLYLLYMHEDEFGKATEEVEKLRQREPGWADALLARIAARADAASKQISRRTLVREKGLAATIRQTVQDVAVSPPPGVDDLVGDLRRLVPHSWLWRSRRGRCSLRWSAFSGRRVRSIRWEEELDELHVQAIFKWALARLIHDEVNERGRLSLRSTSTAEAVLSCIESRFWPGNFTLLFTLLQLENSRGRRRTGRKGAVARNRRENLSALVQRWLKESPTSYWALELVVTDFVRFDGTPLELFGPEFRLESLTAAREQLRNGVSGSSNPKLLAWVDGRLKAEREKVSPGDGELTSGHRECGKRPSTAGLLRGMTRAPSWSRISVRRRV